jgi:hypothetical protein
LEGEDNGILLLTRSRPNDTCLKYIVFYDYSITGVGVRDLADMLKKNSSSIRLKLGCNQISYVGVRISADVLVNHNTKLEQLSLVGIKSINDACIYSIFNIIRYNRTLKIFNLEGCNISYYRQSLIVLCQNFIFVMIEKLLFDLIIIVK